MEAVRDGCDGSVVGGGREIDAGGKRERERGTGNAVHVSRHQERRVVRNEIRLAEASEWQRQTEPSPNDALEIGRFDTRLIPSVPNHIRTDIPSEPHIPNRLKPAG